MQLYLARDNVKSGPFTHLQVKDKLVEGEISAEDLGWHEGLDKWKPLSEIPSAATIIEDLKTAKEGSARAPDSGTGTGTDADTFDEELGSKQVRPFVRFFARFLDVSVFTVIVWIVLGGYPLPDLTGPPEDFKMSPEAARYAILVQSACYLCWNFIEAFLLSYYGTTLGKSLLRVEVRLRDGALPDYRAALMRAFHVWVIGCAVGLPYLREIAQLICLNRFLRNGITPWDRSLGFRVRHRRVGPERIAAYTAILLSSFIALTLASLP